MAQQQVGELTQIALSTERSVEELLPECFNLGVVGVVEDTGALLEAMVIVAKTNQIIKWLVEYQQSILQRCDTP